MPTLSQFNSVCHTILLEKLSLYGFRGNSLQWFKSYLHGRRQRVVFGRAESDWTVACTGVSQGSILGPLLFSIFINDLPATLSRSTVMMYADDTTVYFSYSDAEKVQKVLTEDLGNLSSWIAANGLKMSVKKTQVMMLSRKGREKEAGRLQVSIDNEVFAKCDEIKYLGVIVDNHLTWRSHIEEVRKKCLSALAVLRKLKGSLPPKLRNVLYQLMVLLHLDYCAVVWAECCKDDATKLERIQKSGMWFILNEGGIVSPQ